MTTPRARRLVAVAALPVLLLGACARKAEYRSGRSLTLGSPLPSVTSEPTTTAGKGPTTTAGKGPTTTAGKGPTTTRRATTTTSAATPAVGCAEYRTFQSRQQAAKAAKPAGLTEAVRLLDASAAALKALLPDDAASIDVATAYLEASLGVPIEGEPPTAAQAAKATRDLRTWYSATCTPR